MSQGPLCGLGVRVRGVELAVDDHGGDEAVDAENARHDHRNDGPAAFRSTDRQGDFDVSFLSIDKDI